MKILVVIITLGFLGAAQYSPAYEVQNQNEAGQCNDAIYYGHISGLKTALKVYPDGNYLVEREREILGEYLGADILGEMKMTRELRIKMIDRISTLNNKIRACVKEDVLNSFHTKRTTS